MMTRTEHMEWCKRRALEYVDMGEIPNAWSSMISDIGKHPETSNHRTIELGTMLMMAGHLSSAHEMRKFIVGFN